MSAEFPVAEVSGSAFEMVVQHGRQVEPMIQEYLAWIDQLTGLPRETLRRNAMKLFPRGGRASFT